MTALKGFRILSLQSRPPAETTTYLLAGMGAEVIRIEEPVPPAMIAGGGQSEAAAQRGAAFNALGRNKRSIVLDLRTEAGQDAFYRLAETADVVLEAYRPGVAKRLGVDYETLRMRDPRLVYCSLTGFGQTGPYSALPTHDSEVCAITGATAANLDLDGNPVAYRVLMGDVNAALHAALAITAALLHRGATDQGQYIDISMAACATTVQMGGIAQVLATGSSRHGGSPFDLAAFRCKDGKYISTNNTEARLWANFCRAIELPELVTVSMRSPDWPASLDAIRARMLTRTRDEWFELIREAGASAAPVLSMEEALEDRHFVETGMLMDLEHPTVGPVRQVAFPIRFSATPAEFRSFAPLRGEHTDAVLAELGYNEEARAAFAFD